MVANDLLSLFHTGGAVMYPLLLCSILGVAVAIERTWTLFRASRAATRLHALVTESANRLTAGELLSLLHQHQSPLANVYRSIVRLGAVSADLRLRTAQRGHSQTVREMKRFLWLLGTIGSLAPFIGLFGTVVGIIRAFENMAATGSGGFAVVAAGISEALIATAGGLMVGVLSIFAYNALQVRITNLTGEWRDWTDEFLVLIESPAPAEGSSRRVASPL